MVLRALLVCVAVVIVGSLRIQSDSRLASEQSHHSTSSATGLLFPCIVAWGQTGQKNRMAVLHGPDWVLESSIKPSCFPERDVIFAAKVGEGLLPHPFTARTRLWVTRDHDVTRIRIVDSSGNPEQDMLAVSFVTNHRCIDKNNKNCEKCKVQPHVSGNVI